MMQALQTPTARVPCAPYPSPSRPPQLGRLIRLDARLLSNPDSRLFPFPHLAPFPNHGYLLRAMASAAEPSVQFNEEFSSSNDTEKVKDVAELTLELLEWPRVLLVVSSFGGTASAKELIESFELPSTLGESETLLSMTAAAIDLLSHLGSSLDFGGIQSKLAQKEAKDRTAKRKQMLEDFKKRKTIKIYQLTSIEEDEESLDPYMSSEPT